MVHALGLRQETCGFTKKTEAIGAGFFQLRVDLIRGQGQVHALGLRQETCGFTKKTEAIGAGFFQLRVDLIRGQGQ